MFEKCVKNVSTGVGVKGGGGLLSQTYADVLVNWWHHKIYIQGGKKWRGRRVGGGVETNKNKSDKMCAYFTDGSKDVLRMCSKCIEI